MRVLFQISIDDKSIYNAGLTKEAILQITMETLAREYDSYSLDFDMGYNPNHITNDGAS